MNIVLIGYRGTGKSTIGKILADRLGRAYVGMDSEIIKKAGMSIPEIVERFGWPKFRDFETSLAEQLAAENNMVIDTGGGIVERPENMASLGKNSQVFWLKASVAVIVQRIGGDTQRPALTAGKTFTQEVAEVLESRFSKYRNAADHEIDTDVLSPEQAVDLIVSRLVGSP